MRYLMRQEFFSGSEDYTIKNDTGQDVFLVKCKVFRGTNKFLFQDMQENELAFIQQKFISWSKTYEIYRDSEVYATMNESFLTLLVHEFTVDIPGADQLKVKGNFSGYKYTFKRASGVVATVSKKWALGANTYPVDIISGEDDVLILACTVALFWPTE